MQDHNRQIPLRRFKGRSFVVAGLAVGLIISLFQALTQIQEMTLVFVPKIISIFVVLLVTLPFAGEAMYGLMTKIAARIAAF